MTAHRVEGLGPDEIARRLRHEGLVFSTGPFVCSVRSDVDEIARAMIDHYGENRLGSLEQIVDLDIRVTTVRRRISRSERGFRALVNGVDPFGGALMRHAVPVLETVLNVGLARLNLDLMILHAAVVERAGRALVLPGQSGSGKSTLSAALGFRGWRLLSDEVALIRVGRGDVLPLVRPISLKNDSIALIRRAAPDAFIGRPHEGTAKGTIAYCRPPFESLVRDQETARPAWLVFPTYDASAMTGLTPIDRPAAFIRAMGQAMIYRRLGAAGFHAMADLIETCPAFDLRFQDLEEAVACIDSLTRPI